MTEHSPSYEKANTTFRDAELLAGLHGFESVAQLAETLPPQARVLDVGAGASPFGQEVATLRPDITWINFDYSYKDPAILADASEGAPSNVEYVQGDATRLDEMYPPESFDAVFSYWLLPHLSLDDPAPAEQTARGIFSATKVDGLMAVGPKYSSKLSSGLGKSIRVVKADGLAVDDYVKRIVGETRLAGLARKIQILANEAATPYFGTTRYMKRDEGRARIHDPRSGEYVRPASFKGLRILGGLGLAMARYAGKAKKR